MFGLKNLRTTAVAALVLLLFVVTSVVEKPAVADGYEVTGFHSVWSQTQGGSGTYFWHNSLAAGTGLSHFHFSSPQFQTVDLNQVSFNKTQGSVDTGVGAFAPDPAFGGPGTFTSHGKSRMTYEYTGTGDSHFAVWFQGWLTANSSLPPNVIAGFRNDSFIRGSVDADGDKRYFGGPSGHQFSGFPFNPQILTGINSDALLYSELEGFTGASTIVLESEARLTTYQYQAIGLNINQPPPPPTAIIFGTANATASGVTNLYPGVNIQTPLHQTP